MQCTASCNNQSWVGGGDTYPHGRGRHVVGDRRTDHEGAAGGRAGSSRALRAQGRPAQSNLMRQPLAVRRETVVRERERGCAPAGDGVATSGADGGAETLHGYVTR